MHKTNFLRHGFVPLQLKRAAKLSTAKQPLGKILFSSSQAERPYVRPRKTQLLCLKNKKMRWKPDEPIHGECHGTLAAGAKTSTVFFSSTAAALHTHLLSFVSTAPLGVKQKKICFADNQPLRRLRVSAQKAPPARVRFCDTPAGQNAKPDPSLR